MDWEEKKTYFTIIVDFPLHDYRQAWSVWCTRLLTLLKSRVCVFQGSFPLQEGEDDDRRKAARCVYHQATERRWSKPHY